MADDPNTPDPDAPGPTPDPQPAPEPDPTPSDPTDWKAMARKHEREAKAARTEAARLREAQESEQETAVRKAREEATHAALSTANERILRAEVKAIAGGKLEDPTDAVRLLDLTEFEVDQDGDVDTKAIEKAIKALLADKPYLAAAATRTPGVPTGARPGAPASDDMNASIRRMAGRS